jgi:hypothetical protein
MAPELKRRVGIKMGKTQYLCWNGQVGDQAFLRGHTSANNKTKLICLFIVC